MRRAALLVPLVVVSNVLGNFFMSWGLKSRGAGALGGVALEYITVLFNPWVALGVSLLIVWMLSRLMFFREADLSFVLPVTSIGYVFTAMLGRAFLAENISRWRWAGTLLIVAGAALAGSTEMRTGESAVVPAATPEFAESVSAPVHDPQSTIHNPPSEALP